MAFKPKPPMLGYKESETRGRPGMSVRDARGAGIVEEIPMPEWMAKDIAALTPPPPPTQQDQRKAIERRYNISNGVANITPIEFLDILRNPTKMGELIHNNIATWNIDNGQGLSANFKLFDPEKTDVSNWPLEDTIHSSILIKQGLGLVRTKGSLAIVYNDKRVYGLLGDNHSPVELDAHARMSIGRYKGLEGLSATLLTNSDFLRIAIKQMQNTSTPSLPLSFRKAGEEETICLGTVSALDDTAPTLPLTTLPMIRACIGSRSSIFKERILSDIFHGHSAVAICIEPKNPRPIAILTYPEAQQPQ